jgi:hypothetical protein
MEEEAACSRTGESGGYFGSYKSRFAYARNYELALYGEDFSDGTLEIDIYAGGCLRKSFRFRKKRIYGTLYHQTPISRHSLFQSSSPIVKAGIR